MRIERLYEHIPVRAMNCIKSLNLVSVEELLSIDKQELLKTPNFGKTSYDEVCRALRVLGFEPVWDGQALKPWVRAEIIWLRAEVDAYRSTLPQGWMESFSSLSPPAQEWLKKNLAALLHAAHAST